MAFHHTEAQLETLFRLRVTKSLGGHVVKLAPTVAGIPDRMVLLPAGRLRLVELKTVTGRLSPIQVEWHRRAAGLGVTVDVLHGLDDIELWVRQRIRELDALFDDLLT